MKMLMKKLNLEIPTFILHRRLVIEVSEHKKSHLIKIEGLDVDNTPASIFKGVELIIPGKEKNEAIIEEPFVFTVVLFTLHHHDTDVIFVNRRIHNLLKWN
jgi:hypothetical protein